MSALVAAGVDGSTTSTGVALLWDGGHRFSRFRTKPESGSLLDQVGRIDSMVESIRSELQQVQRLGVIVYEAPAFNQHGQGGHFLGGMWWCIARMLVELAPVAVASPGTVKKFATGNGGHSTGKAEMVAAAAAAFPDDKWLKSYDDMADAAALAGLGAVWLGLECGGVFAPSGRGAGTAVHWPELRGEDHAPAA